uniref:Uncharacterized protein n=1 Tax=Anguilla anguilla TaxID=7936 RepID=A0A0E9QH22_ANGAN
MCLTYPFVRSAVRLAHINLSTQYILAVFTVTLWIMCQ